MEPRIDVNVITQPLKDARDRLAAEVAEHKNAIAAIESAAQIEATEVLRRAADKAEPIAQQVRTAEAHIARFNLLIAKEEQAAGVAPAAGQQAPDPYRAPATPGVAEQDGGDRG